MAPTRTRADEVRELLRPISTKTLPLADSFTTFFRFDNRTGGVKLGASKAYGAPHLPADWKPPRGWPKGIKFLFQVDLTSLARFDIEERLPRAGLLLLFQHPGNLVCRLVLAPEGTALAPYSKLAWGSKEEAFEPEPYWSFGLGAKAHAKAVKLAGAKLIARIDKLLGMKLKDDTSASPKMFGKPTWRDEIEALAFEDQGDAADGPALLLFEYEIGQAILHVHIRADKLKRADFRGAWQTG